MDDRAVTYGTDSLEAFILRPYLMRYPKPPDRKSNDSGVSDPAAQMKAWSPGIRVLYAPRDDVMPEVKGALFSGILPSVFHMQFDPTTQLCGRIRLLHKAWSVPY